MKNKHELTFRFLEDNKTILYDVSAAKPPPPFSCSKLSAKIIVYSVAGVMVATKVITSVGQRWFSINDLFTNPNYFYHSSIQVIPASILDSTNFSCSIADGWVNGGTRGPALFQKITEKLFNRHEKLSSSLSALSLSQSDTLQAFSKCKRISKRVTDVILGVSILCAGASLIGPAYLGAVTTSELVSDNLTAHITLGMTSIVATLATNITFRFSKISTNYEKVWQGKIKPLNVWQYGFLSFYLIGSFGNFTYGLTHGVPKMLEQLFGYHLAVNNPILRTTSFTVAAFCLVPLLFSKGFEIFNRPANNIIEYDNATSTSKLIRVSCISNKQWGVLNRCCFIDMPTALLFISLGLSYLGAGFDGLGNMLTMLNSGIGLMAVFVEDNPWAILPCAFLLATLDTIVYSLFNFPDMLRSVKELFLACAKKALLNETEGASPEETIENLKNLLNLKKVKMPNDYMPEDYFESALFDGPSKDLETSPLRAQGFYKNSGTFNPDSSSTLLIA